MAPSKTDTVMTPRRVGEALWRRRLACAITAVIILVVGSVVVLTRQRVYESTSSVALLPASKNPGILPNYPNLIISLVPTYVQLVSSPVLLNQVAAKVPFHTTGTELASQVHAESLSNAAIINIVAQAPNPIQARAIASVATTTFLRQLHGNGAVIPKTYGQPTVPTPMPPNSALLLGVVLVLAVILGAAAGLIWDRLAGAAVPAGAGSKPGHSSSDLRQPESRPTTPLPPERASARGAGTATPIEPFGNTVKLRPASGQSGQPGARREAGRQLSASGEADDESETSRASRNRSRQNPGS